jgi:PAS domain-containing protein
VALACSAWSARLGWSDRERDELELAALLHDIGKIGVPDALLLKPAPLTPDEYQVVERFRQTGVQILRTCCANEAVLQAVAHAGAWFDGRREGTDLRGEQLPLAARVLAIVDAYDAMTSDQVYRRALSQERALAELFEYAGSQFDPRLVQEFCAYVNADPIKLQAVVARRWLTDLSRSTFQPECWRRAPQTAVVAGGIEAPFYCKLLESMHDAVIFVDSTLKIMLWNTAAERLTGITAASIEQWRPDAAAAVDHRTRRRTDRRGRPRGPGARQGGRRPRSDRPHARRVQPDHPRAADPASA